MSYNNFKNYFETSWTKFNKNNVTTMHIYWKRNTIKKPWTCWDNWKWVEFEWEQLRRSENEKKYQMQPLFGNCMSLARYVHFFVDRSPIAKPVTQIFRDSVGRLGRIREWEIYQILPSLKMFRGWQLMSISLPTDHQVVLITIFPSKAFVKSAVSRGSQRLAR